MLIGNYSMLYSLHTFSPAATAASTAEPWASERGLVLSGQR